MQVIYIQLKSEFEAAENQQVRLLDIARISPPDKELAEIPFDIPAQGRRVDALEVIARVATLRPQARIEPVGAGDIFVSRVCRRRGIGAWLIKIALPVFLFGGAAMGITFFHADVNMLDAQNAILGMFGGGEAEPLELAIPYSIGVFVGVGAFLLLGGRAKSPLALKLRDYRKQLEQSDDED